MKKFISPIIFSISFLVLWQLTLVTIEVALPRGDYGGLGIVMLVLFVWLIFVLPIYCIRYSKTIMEEKFRFLFAAYNSILIFSHMIPFSLDDEWMIIIPFVLWVLIWNFAFLLARILVAKRAKRIPAEQDVYYINALLQNKKKNIIVACFTSVYVLVLLSDMAYSFFSSVISLISAICVLVLLITAGKTYWLKKHLLTIAMSAELLYVLFLFINTYKNLRGFIYLCFMLVVDIALVVGTICNFKFIKLLRYGALCRCATIVLNIVSTVFEMIKKEYFSFELILLPLLSAAFFIGIFILATNKIPPMPEVMAENTELTEEK